MNQNIKETCIMSAKIEENIMSMKKVILGILVHAFMKMTNI